MKRMTRVSGINSSHHSVFPPQNKSLKNKLLSGNKLCDAYAEEVSLFKAVCSVITSTVAHRQHVVV